MAAISPDVNNTVLLATKDDQYEFYTTEGLQITGTTRVKETTDQIELLNGQSAVVKIKYAIDKIRVSNDGQVVCKGSEQIVERGEQAVSEPQMPKVFAVDRGTFTEHISSEFDQTWGAQVKTVPVGKATSFEHVESIENSSVPFYKKAWLKWAVPVLLVTAAVTAGYYYWKKKRNKLVGEQDSEENNLKDDEGETSVSESDAENVETTEHIELDAIEAV